MPNPGELLGGRYRLDDRIAAGGMGEVWAATDTVLSRPVAVKTLLGGHGTDPGFRTRFRHEAQAMAALRHPGVVAVYDFGDTGDDDAYLVMARVGGQPLNRLLADRGHLSVAETMSIVAQAAHALHAAHEAGIVHRDVKPGNLIIEPDGTVVLVDFGVARSANSVTLTGAREVVGTALYIAPEQVSKRATGPAADIYALGAVAYHCLAGRPPFLGDNPLVIALQHVTDEPPSLPREVPRPVRDLIGIALAKDPAERYPSAAALAAAAEAAAGTAAGDTLAATGVLADPAVTAGAGAPDRAAGAADPQAATRPVPAGAAAAFAGRALVGGPRYPDPGPARDGHTMAGATAAALGTAIATVVGADRADDRPAGAPPGSAGAPERGRRRALAAAAAVLLLLGLSAAIALADPFHLFDGGPQGTPPGAGTPSPAVSASPEPATSRRREQGGGPAERTRGPAATAPGAATTGATGTSGTTRPTTTAPAGTAATTTAPAPTTAAPTPTTGGEDGGNENDGGNEGDGGDENDDSGPGGGDEGGNSGPGGGAG